MTGGEAPPSGQAAEPSPWLPRPLGTPRLRLRALRDRDREFLVALHSDPEARRYLGGPRPPETLEAELADRPLGRRWGVFAVTERTSDEPLATVELAWESGELEVSWVLRSQHWGQGYATEAVHVVLRWAFEQSDAPRIIAVTQTANRASCRLAERLGMRRVAVVEEFGAEQARYVLERPRESATPP